MSSKKIEKGGSFKIAEKRPKVLLLGNGIVRAFGEGSWDDLLAKIANKSTDLDPSAKYDMPNSMKATLLTNNNLQENLKTYYENSKTFNISDKLKDFLQKILALDFDHIITTNYSYEIECALFGRKISKDTIYNSQRAFKTRCKTHYLLHTFNQIKDHKIWHIHGEIRKPSSIVLGYYAYGKLISHYVSYLGKQAENFVEKSRKNKSITIKSWLDAFVLGDVYILGFGLDFAEIDSWWLLDYKTKKPTSSESFCGKTVFIAPKENSADKFSYPQCKYELLKTYKVETEDFGISIPADDNSDNKYKKETKDQRNELFRAFYEKAYEYLTTKIGKR